jgi:carboxylesterase type B
MFWIHGGSFQLGSARLPDYDGSSLAVSQDVVVMTTNYRLNGESFQSV